MHNFYKVPPIPVDRMPRKKKAEAEDNSCADIEKAQPVVNIGLVGHVDHGKTTLTERLTGKWTDTHSEEMKRGITIRLGYADVIFRKCTKCKIPVCYTVKKKCPICDGETVPLRKVSFVDAPGHESLMATMLSGSKIMDGAMLLVAANEICPQPQTREYLMALSIAGIKNIVIIQNKIDIVTTERATRNHEEIVEFIKGTDYENSPIIPISALHGANIDLLIEALEKVIPTPKRNPNDEPVMFIARSFDINKPGARPKDLQGGVIGGALTQGKLKIGEKIELRPGRIVEEHNKRVAKPIETEIASIITGGCPVKEVLPGGSIGVMTLLDPAIVKSDNLTGNIVGHTGKLPPIWYELKLETHLLERVVGSQDELKVDPIKMNEILMLNVNSAATVGFVEEIGKNFCMCRLKLPVCADKGSRVTISRRVGTRFRLIGYGLIEE